MNYLKKILLFMRDHPLILYPNLLILILLLLFPIQYSVHPLPFLLYVLICVFISPSAPSPPCICLQLFNEWQENLSLQLILHLPGANPHNKYSQSQKFGSEVRNRSDNICLEFFCCKNRCFVWIVHGHRNHRLYIYRLALVLWNYQQQKITMEPYY